ncbi:MAG TPA: hypothetical protein VFA86_13905 [Gammaproteobacteria bacterium]|nr:hypothetical protein [Gammaproteobacteria bacterium]
MPCTRQQLVAIRQTLHARLQQSGGRYWNDEKALHMLARAHVQGIPLAELRSRARTATSWSGFFGEIDARLCGEVD